MIFKVFMHAIQEIVDDNVAEVARETSAAIQEADDLGTVHVNLAADITTQVANVSIITKDVSEILVFVSVAKIEVD